MALGIVFCELLAMILLNKLLFNNIRLIELIKDIKTSLLLAIIYTIIVGILSKNSSLALVIVIIIHTHITSKNIKKSFMLNLIKIVICSIIISVTELVFLIPINLLFIGIEFSSICYFFVNIFAMSSVLILTDKLMKDRIFKLDINIKRYRKYFVLCINIVIFFLFYKNVIQIESISTTQIVNMGMLSIILVCANVVYFYNVIKQDKLTKKVEIKESINPLIEELIDKMRCSEHEYKNHLNILYCMMQVCEEDVLKDRAKKYIGEAIANANLLSRVSDIENIIIKAILLSKIKKAEENEIDLEYVIDSTLESLPLDDSELTVVLSNLLNNAIEAASSSEDKFIEVFVGENNEKHIIKVTNSTKNFSKDKIDKIMQPRYSTKGEGRGYGLYNIKNVVEKYKGNMDISFEDNIIEVLVEI